MDLDYLSEMATSVAMTTLMDWSQLENSPQLNTVQESTIQVKAHYIYYLVQ